MPGNKTPWFSPEVKPEHIGVYEIDVDGDLLYAYWTGDYWLPVAYSPQEAEEQVQTPAKNQAKVWRGFTEEQK